MSNSNTISPYTERPEINLDHSNTPIVPDGTGGFTTRGASSRIQQGFVIFIDVLGIKGVWKRMSAEMVIKNWMDIIRQFTESIDKSLRHLKPYFTTLSDTIIITCECSISNINTIFQSLMQPFSYSMGLDFFLRGTISYGMTFISPRLVLGPALDDAAEGHNMLEWIGIATTPCLSAYYLGNGYAKQTDNYSYYPTIPVKKVGDNNNGYSPLYFRRKGYYEGLALNLINQNNGLRQLLTNKRNSHTKLEIKCKYENTLAFLDYCEKTVHAINDDKRNHEF